METYSDEQLNLFTIIINDRRRIELLDSRTLMEVIDLAEYNIHEGQEGKYLYDIIDQCNRTLDERSTGPKNRGSKPGTVIWAWYYAILHEVNNNMEFYHDIRGVIPAMKEAIKGKDISFKNFQTTYNKLRIKLESHVTSRKLPYLQKVAELFKDNPACLKLVNEYINKASLQK
jgi:hypothetical protein